MEEQRRPWRNLPVLGFVVLLQIALIYALVAGLGKNIIEKINAPIETKIIKEDKPPPPPPPPPPPDLAPPPPQAYIPPPEIAVQPPPPTNNAIQAVQRTVAPVFTRPAPTAPAVPDQGPSRNPAVGSSRPEYPDSYQDSGRSGVVNVRCTIQADGRPTNCALVSVAGGAAFGSSVMQWLNSGTAKYSPAIRNGQRVAAPAELQVDFEPSE